MIPWLKRFFMDETAFVGLFRGVLQGTGAAVATGMLDVSAYGIPTWVGIAMLAAGGFVRSSSHTRSAKEPKP